MKKFTKKSMAVLCLLFYVFVLNAQIVNIEKQRQSQPDSIHWFGYINLGLNLVENDKSILTILGDMRHDFSKNRHTFLSITRYNLGRVEGADFINNGFQHLRYNYQLKPWLVWEAFTQLQYNERLNLRIRSLIGTGPRFRLKDEERYQIYFGTLYMFEYGEETTGEGSDFVKLRDHRLSNYLSINIQPLSHLHFNSTSYYQPVINDLTDWRLSSESSIILTVTEKLKFNSTFSIAYDSDVQEGVPHRTYLFSNGIRWRF